MAKNQVVMQFRLPEETHRRLKEQAEQVGVSMNQLATAFMQVCSESIYNAQTERMIVHTGDVMIDVAAIKRGYSIRWGDEI